MRLHHLSMTAFGPFAGSEEVDFDELCEAGLFLLTGPTGAGKTTVLDAVCFALYGSVPGVRGVKALKSQHAPDDVRPEVVLDFSVRERRFVVRRTPEWTRPKRRGEGFTTENASATLVEKTAGEDHLLSSRAQEVGHFIGELVGMQSTQFVQVAMLPQGDFQKFLRASSQDRHDVLQHLFRSDRYARIEDWVHDHSRGLRERSATQQQAVVRVLDTVAERALAELPEAVDGDALQAGEAQQQALSWVDVLVEAAGTARTAALDQHAAATAAAADARSLHEEGLTLRALHERRDTALRALAGLAAGEAEEEAAREALDRHSRAAQCLPLLRMLDDSVRRRATLADGWARASARLEDLDLSGLMLPDPLTADALADLEQSARSGAARLEALLPREEALRRARVEAEAVDAALASVVATHESATERGDALPVAIEEARAQVAAKAATAGRLEALELELAQARSRLKAAEAARDCADSILALKDSERDARDRAAEARDRVQDLTARRLTGIAAELAGQLVEGQACQVCGSSEHPAPATTEAAVVTEAEQAEAAAAHDAAAAAHSDATGRVLQAAERLEGLRAAADDLEPAAAGAEVDRLSDALTGARQARQQLEQAEKQLARLTREQAELDREVTDLTVERATLTQTLESHRRAIETVTAELESEVQLDVPLAEQVRRRSTLADSLARSREVLCDLDSAAARVEELENHVDEAAREHGFDSVTALRGAPLADAERSRLEGLLETRRQTFERATAVLDEEAVKALDDHPLPDVAALAAAAADAEAVEAAAARVRHQREETAEALARLRERLRAALEAWRPVLTEFLRADSMSKLVRGMGADNQLQMRLSAYVLATRLDQVVAAANERLAHMRDQRYLLQRTGRAARKGAQAGLGLEVVDQWTGDVRDPATLSGGETFVVSLALALGLADVVTQEAGGTEIETLFVDEGFGTLDADTLDDVMDRLDDLRAGGRAVGVVSHVSELRNRIPTQLHVEKRRDGSVVAVRTAVG
ncbi:MAG TPA: SMC family ATPase [Nocardioidaceae bacterium]|nr:SMC family ATPase [Nocardioidaceae bacterium]